MGSRVSFSVLCFLCFPSFNRYSGPPGAVAPYPVARRSYFFDFGRSKDRFLKIFGRPGAISKNIDFSTSAKIDRGAVTIDPWALRARFLVDFHDFWGTLLAPFFDFFEKVKNHEIDDPYNVLEGFSPSETSHFSMDFPLFSCFSRNPSRSAFLEGPGADLFSKVRFCCSFGNQPGPKINPWGDLFGRKVDFSVSCFRGQPSRDRPFSILTDFYRYLCIFLDF